MRIAIVAPPWVPVPPPAYGGTEAVLDTLARGLVAAGHDVLLYATGDSGCAVPRAWTYDTAAGFGSAAGAVTELRHVVDAYDAVRDADVVHDHTLFGPLYATRVPSFTVVTTNHGPFTRELTSLYRAVAPRVAVVAISHDQARRARGVPIAAVIHHGVDIGRFPVGDGQGGYALFLGRMSPDKGVHTAAEAARAAGIPLRIAAKMREPAELEYFRACVEPLLGGEIEYVGEVGGADKFALLGGAVCLLNPIAWQEPFGMVMIEALASGTPVVATNRGAASEIVRHGRTGFVVEREDELVAALRRVADLDRAACRRDAERRFSAERFVDDHVALYERVVDARPAVRRKRIRDALRGSAAFRADLPSPAGHPGRGRNPTAERATTPSSV